MSDGAADDPFEAQQLERAADWRIKKLGANPQDRQSADAARLLQRLADDVRRLRGSATYREYIAICNWLGEFDSLDDFAQRADEYRAGIGVAHAPDDGEEYLRALIGLARQIIGT